MLVPLVVGLVYIVVAEAVIILPGVLNDLPIQRLDPSDTLSLLTGAVTAATLFALYLQAKGAREEAEHRATQLAIDLAEREHAASIRAEEEAAARSRQVDAQREREKQLAIQAAVRADQLHAEFNTADMIRQRILGLEYLKFLRSDPELMARYARIWVTDGSQTTAVPDRKGPDGAPLTFEQYSWALDIVVTFFARLGSYLRLNKEQLGEGTSEAEDMLGPFCWLYWKQAGIVEWIDACKEAHRLDSVQPRPYFIDNLERVNNMHDSFTRAASSTSCPTAQHQTAKTLGLNQMAT